MGICFEPSRLRADKQMLNSFTAVLFWKWHVATHTSGPRAQNVTPGPQPDFMLGRRALSSLIPECIDCTAESTSQTEVPGCPFKASQKRIHKIALRGRGHWSTQKGVVYFKLFSFLGLIVTCSLERGLLHSGYKAHKGSWRLLPSSRCLKTLQECMDFDCFQV